MDRPSERDEFKIVTENVSENNAEELLTFAQSPVGSGS
jgi:hypothetical protein